MREYPIMKDIAGTEPAAELTIDMEMRSDWNALSLRNQIIIELAVGATTPAVGETASIYVRGYRARSEKIVEVTDGSTEIDLSNLPQIVSIREDLIDSIRFDFNSTFEANADSKVDIIVNSYGTVSG